jgi:hypothetical protein
MTTVKLNAKIDALGKLLLDVPVGLPPGGAEVIVVVQPEQDAERKSAATIISARSGLFDAKLLQHLDPDAALNEMNQAWKSKLANLP